MQIEVYILYKLNNLVIFAVIWGLDALEQSL